MTAERGYNIILTMMPFLKEPDGQNACEQIKRICLQIEASAYNKGFIDGQLKVARGG